MTWHHLGRPSPEKLAVATSFSKPRVINADRVTVRVNHGKPPVVLVPLVYRYQNVPLTHHVHLPHDTFGLFPCIPEKRRHGKGVARGDGTCLLVVA